MRRCILVAGLWALGCAGDDSSGDAGDTSGTTSADATSTGSSMNTTDAGTTDAGTTESTGSTGAADSETSVGTTVAEMTTSGTDDGTTSTSTGRGSSTTGAGLCDDAAPIAGLDSAVAILIGDKPPDDPTGGGITSVGGSGGGPAPEDLRIRLSNAPLTCADPDGDFECENFEKWRVTITVPADLIGVGSFDFSDLIVAVSVIGPGAPPDCPGGGGGGFDGTLVIESIGPAGVVGCIQDSDNVFTDINGSFTADNCSDI